MASILESSTPTCSLTNPKMIDEGIATENVPETCCSMPLPSIETSPKVVGDGLAPEIVPDTCSARPLPSIETRPKVIRDETLERRVRIVLTYAWIKEEMVKSSALSVADHLYQDRLLPGGQLEMIHEAKYRRDAIEILLKFVLLGSPETQTSFFKAVRNIGEEFVADKIESTTVLDKHIQEFYLLEKYSLGKAKRPDDTNLKTRFQSEDLELLICHFNEKYTIDVINDEYLSRLLFSIREHTNIVHCSLEDEKRVKKLLDTMLLCSERTFQDLNEICRKLQKAHVIEPIINNTHTRKIRTYKGLPYQTSSEDSEPIYAQCDSFCREQDDSKPALELEFEGHSLAKTDDSSSDANYISVTNESKYDDSKDIDNVKEYDEVQSFVPHRDSSMEYEIEIPPPKREKPTHPEGKSSIRDETVLRAPELESKRSEPEPRQHKEEKDKDYIDDYDDEWEEYEALRTEMWQRKKDKDYIDDDDDGELYEALPEEVWQEDWVEHINGEGKKGDEQEFQRSECFGKQHFEYFSPDQPASNVKRSNENICSAFGINEETKLMLIEELEITDDLLQFLKEKSIVKETIDKGIRAQSTRAGRIKYLLEQIAHKRCHGFNVLKDYIKGTNPVLYNDLVPANQRVPIPKKKLFS